MKIAVVANTGWYLWNFRRPLMAALRADGHDVLALSPEDDYVGMLQAEGHAWQPLALSAAGTNPLLEAATLLRLHRQLRQAGVQLLLTYTPKVNIYSGLSARRSALLHVPNVSGLGRVFIRRSWVTRVVTRLYRWAFERAPRVVFQNDDDRQQFEALGLVRPEQVLRVPGSGVDLERFAPVPMTVPDPAAPCLLFVGRLLRDKGAVEFVEAARAVRARWPKARFRMLGPLDSDNPSAVPRALLDEWRAEGVVELLGAHDDVRPALAQAHAVVLPSYREGVPRALLEAAAMARPCIATNVPGCRDAVEHGVNGLLCEARSSSALAGAIEQFVSAGPTAWAAWGSAGRQRMCERFDERLVIETYRRLVAELAGRGGGPNGSARPR